MEKIVFIYILSCCLSSSNTVKLFRRNTNFWNNDNWKEGRAPCLGNHIIFPLETPKIFLDEMRKGFQISEMNLPYNGELILDNGVTITTAQFDSESHHCDTSVSHYNKVEPDFWYNPDNWCHAESINLPCVKKPQVEASIVPSAEDLVVFLPNNSFYIGFIPSEPKILARRINYHGIMYSHSILFRQKIRRTFINKIVEFVNVNSSLPPLIELQGSRCKKNVCGRNSNLERMQTICKYVSCRTVSCNHPVRPVGSCCYICGHILILKLPSYEDKGTFNKWLIEVINKYYSNDVLFDLLSVNVTKVQLTVTPTPHGLGKFNDIVLKIMDVITAESKTNKAYTVKCLTCSKPITGSYSMYIIFQCILPTVALILIILIIVKRYKSTMVNILSNKFSAVSNIQLSAINFQFFRQSFSKSRLEEQLDDTDGEHSIGIVAIELSESGREISFDNPIFQGEVNDTKQ